MSILDNLLSIDYWQTRQLVALCNWGLCCAIGWACICRISVASSETTRGLTRWSYAALFVGATASGFGPLRGHWAGLPEIAMNAAVLLLLIDGVSHWRSGVPNDVRKERRHSARWKKDDLT